MHELRERIEKDDLIGADAINVWANSTPEWTNLLSSYHKVGRRSETKQIQGKAVERSNTDKFVNTTT